MVVACIVQARVKSSRLPAKTMLLLPTGRTAVEETLWRCLRIEGVTHVVVAIPDTPDCDLLEYHLATSRWFMASKHPYIENGWAEATDGVKSFVRIVRGSEDDVLSRYHKAAEVVDATTIMRITSDCPCLQTHICENILSLHISGGYDYTSNCFPRSFVQGFDCEVFSREMLDAAHLRAKDKICREHVTPFFNGSFDSEQIEYAERGNYRQDADDSQKSLTLDTVEDFIAICAHMRAEQVIAAGECL